MPGFVAGSDLAGKSSRICLAGWFAQGHGCARVLLACKINMALAWQEAARAPSFRDASSGELLLLVSPAHARMRAACGGRADCQPDG